MSKFDVKVVGTKVVSNVGTIATFDTEAEAEDYCKMVNVIEAQRSANREFKKAKGW